MKKLMIAMMVAGAAVVANAAKASWGSGELYFNGEGSKLDGTGGGSLVADGTATGWVFALGIDDAGKALFNQIATSADIWDNFDAVAGTLTVGTTVLTATKGPTSSEEGEIAFGSTGTSYINNGQKLYSAMVIAYDPDKDGVVDFYSANATEKTAGTSGASQSTMGHAWTDVDGKNPVATTWIAAQDVPEPTSGLLLLLGVAGLALRRRRA